MSERAHYVSTGGKLGLSLWLNAPMLKTIRFLSGIREIFFTGITIGQIGIGIVISRKAKGGE